MGKKTKKDVGAILRRNGVDFRVWAPFADDVSIKGSFNNWSSDVPLINEGDGYWSCFIKGAMAGQEYKYFIKNGDELLIRNDPRAYHFTTSAGNSVITKKTYHLETSNFQPIPIDQQIIYELHVGTFNRPDAAINGTFNDLIDKLDYLKELGINMIELMPINSMMMDRGWGYAIDYIYSVESLYGGRYGFMKFIEAAHAKGIGVILDLVFNHFGPDNNMDLWNFDGWHQENMGGIYFYNDWRAETPWGNTRPDFGRPEVQQYILDSVSMWMHDCRVDGLRIDSTIYIRNVKGSNNDPEHDLPEGWLLLQRINSIAKKINPYAITIAEDVADNEYLVKSSKQGGAGFNSQWELNFPFALREALYSDNPDMINLASLCAELTHRYNDDPFARIIFVDSHDTAANGSARFNDVISPGKADSTFAKKQSLIAAAILLTAPGIPMLFQGQEFLQGGSFNDWQGLNWENVPRMTGIIEAYKHLIALRKNQDGISAGLCGRCINLLHVDDDNKVIAYHRWRDGGPKDDVVILINFGNRLYQRYELGFPRNGLWKVRFNSNWKGYCNEFSGLNVEDVEVENGGGSILLPPSTVVILSQD